MLSFALVLVVIALAVKSTAADYPKVFLEAI